MLALAVLLLASCGSGTTRITFEPATTVPDDAGAATTTLPADPAPETTLAAVTTTAAAPTTVAPTTTSATISTTTTTATTQPPPPLADGFYNALVFFVDLGEATISIDPVEWTWTGPADTEGYWTNDDPTPVLLPLASGVVFTACPEDMSGPFPPMLHCQPGEHVVHPIDKLALWVHNGVTIGQNDRFLADIPGHNGQHWVIWVASGEVTAVDPVWWP